MTRKPLRVLVLVHETLVPPETTDGYTQQQIDEWRTEYDVTTSLRAMGHDVRVLGLGDNLSEGCQTLTEALTGFGDVFTGGDIDVQEIAEAMATIADNAPEEIAPEMAIIAEAYTSLAVALEGVDINDPSTFQDPEIAARLQEASQIFSTPEFTDAITAMSEFLATECSGVPTG